MDENTHTSAQHGSVLTRCTFLQNKMQMSTASSQVLLACCIIVTICEYNVYQFKHFLNHILHLFPFLAFKNKILNLQNIRVYKNQVIILNSFYFQTIAQN